MRRDSKHPRNEPSFYAGRWIARLRGEIVGQGGTPKQALQAAKAARYKENPEISFVPMSVPLNLSPILDRIRSTWPMETPIYLVGGAVRDMLRGHTVHDFDFVLPANALAISRQLANRIGAAYFPLDPERGTARLIYKDERGIRNILDFAAYRGPDLESDLRDRDFTINAMALDLQAPQELLDPLGGATDLYEKRLRACAPTSFRNDPIRVLRAIRLAANLDLHIQPETRSWMGAAVPGLADTSPERKRDELLRILTGAQAHTSIRALEMLDALPYVLPELPDLADVTQSPPHIKDVWNHTLDTLRALEEVLDTLGTAPDLDAANNLTMGVLNLKLGRYRKKISTHLQIEPVTERPLRALLFFAALYHDIAKPQTRTVEETGRVRFFHHDEIGSEIITPRAGALHLSNIETQRMATIVRHHMRPSFLAHTEGGPSKRAIYRFFRDTGEAGVDICLLSLADVLATYGPTLPQERWSQQVDTVRTLLDAWWENPSQQVHPPSLISGHDLIDTFRLKPGPQIGEILEAIREAQAEGEVASRQDALTLARGLLDESK